MTVIVEKKPGLQRERIKIWKTDRNTFLEIQFKSQLSSDVLVYHPGLPLLAMSRPYWQEIGVAVHVWYFYFHCTDHQSELRHYNVALATKFPMDRSRMTPPIGSRTFSTTTILIIRNQYVLDHPFLMSKARLVRFNQSCQWPPISSTTPILINLKPQPFVRSRFIWTESISSVVAIGYPPLNFSLLFGLCWVVETSLTSLLSVNQSTMKIWYFHNQGIPWKQIYMFFIQTSLLSHCSALCTRFLLLQFQPQVKVIQNPQWFHSQTSTLI